MISMNIYYMWNFKPNEKLPFPQDVIRHNANFTPSYSIITPANIYNLIHNDTFPELVQLYSQIPHWVV
jgi:hypothetical protein